MPHFLPDHMLALFTPRAPLVYKPPMDEMRVPHRKRRNPYTGVAQCLQFFEEPSETPAKPQVESSREAIQRWKRDKEELAGHKLEEAIAKWHPKENPHATKNPYRTLFVGRLHYSTDEKTLKRAFQRYGKVKRCRLVVDRETSKSRGYAFIEFAHEDEMSDAYHRSRGLEIDGRRVLVDYERGRTRSSWLPRRLGGGKGGGTRARRVPSSAADDWNQHRKVVFKKEEGCDNDYTARRDSRSASMFYDGRGGDGFSGGGGPRRGFVRSPIRPSPIRRGSVLSPAYRPQQRRESWR